MPPANSTPRRDPLNRKYSLPRLPRDYYQGDSVVLWTLPTFDRSEGWLTEKLHGTFRELMLHAAAREGLACPIYCLMPDHIHLVWMGLRRDTDQFNAMSFLRTYLEPAIAPACFQPQAHDTVLRAEERKRGAFSRTCFYVAANPVRAELVNKPGDWRYTGCTVAGYPNLNPGEEGFWEKFWKIFAKLRAADAGNIVRPSI